MRVNYFGLKYLTEQLWDKLADNSTVVNVASIAGNNWRRRRAALTEMLAIDSFAEGVAWYNEHEQAVDIDAYTFSKEAVVVNNPTAKPPTRVATGNNAFGKA